MTITNGKWMKYFAYLDGLRESGETNMFGAGPYLREEFDELNKMDASTVLVTWMKTFSDKSIAERVGQIE